MSDNHKIKIPSRPYYPLKKAADMLSIGLDDLMYLGETGYVDFIYRIEGQWVSNGGDTASFDFLNFEPDESSDDKRSCVAHAVSGLYQSPIVYFSSRSKGGDRFIIVEGFLALRPFSSFGFYQKILHHNSAPLSETVLALPVNDRVSSSTYGDHPGFAIDMRFSGASISLNDLFISFTEISRIRALTTACNTDTSDATALIDEQRRERPALSPRVAPKTVNSQVTFIRSLLKVFCPKALEQPTGNALPAAFAKKGEELPVSQKTIANWLKQLDEK